MTQENIEIVFNFDTTGSMYPVLDQVRRNLEATVGSLLKEIPNLKIGLGANGDYCDLVPYGYVTKQIDLTNNLYDLTQFVRGVKPTGGGGNGGEAYCESLKEAQTVYNWSLNSRKILVMIGDEISHGPTFRDNKNHTNWRDEAKKLANMGIQIYTIQCLSRREAPPYYSELASIGNGLYLRLDQFTDILSLVNGIIYKQVSTEKLDNFEAKLVSAGKMNRVLDQSFGVLTGRPRDAKGRFVKLDTSLSKDLLPVDPGRFQIMDVDKEQDIRSYVTDHSLIFSPGKGFYQFQKSETIQSYKEIVLREKTTGDMYTGKRARELLGIPTDREVTISPRTITGDSSKYDVFIQSTSYNRKLKPSTKFLYEVDMSA